MEKIKIFLSKYIFVLIFILSWPAVWALLVPGFYGASDDIHIAWLYEMDKVLRIWQLPPRFVPDLSFGFGYPLFNFVFPLPFYIGEIFHLFGLSLVDSIKAVFLISIPLSMFFMYRFLKEFTNDVSSLAGAIIYGFTPYRSTDIYVRGAFGESLSFVFLPLIALSVVKSFQGFNMRWMAIGGLSWAALILSHNIMAYMFLPFILLLIFMQFFFLKSGKILVLLQVILMSLLGLLISLYFWLPAILDSKLMVYDTVFNFADHFPTLKQLVTPYWGYGASVPGPGDGMSFFIGVFNLLALAFGAIFLIYFWKKFSQQQKIILLWAEISFLLAFLMMNNRSTFLWEHLPFLPFFQFPWRFLIITTFVTPIFLIAFEKVKFNLLFSFFLIGGVILLSVSYFKPHDFLGRTDSYYLNRYIPVPYASQEYLKTQEEYLRLPLNTAQRPKQNFPLVSADGSGLLKVEEFNGIDAVIKTNFEKESLLSYNKYFFPGWKAEVDGQVVLMSPGFPYGQIVLSVPSGPHLLKITFEETAFKKMVDIISLLSILAAIILTLGFGAMPKWSIFRYNIKKGSNE